MHSMSTYLHVSVTFLDSRFHGRGDGGEPEWPPSPLRLMQAIIAANSDVVGVKGDLDRALMWLEEQDPPLIVAPPAEEAEPYRLSVPNNAMDIVGRAWLKGNYFGSGDANPATHRTMKTFRPIRMVRGDTVHYLWKLDDSKPKNMAPIEPLIRAARRIVALGWGIDLVVGSADCIPSEKLEGLSGERWLPTVSKNIAALRTPVPDTFVALRERYDSFLHRVGEMGFTPVAPLTQFKVTGYRRPTDSTTYPYALFELRHNDGSFCRYPQRKLMRIAGIVRHLATELMLHSPPQDVNENWVERYVMGHRDENAEGHRQFSYLPLPSIGHKFADQSVRRVMIAAPVGDDAWLDHLAPRLAGRQLKTDNGDEFGEQGPPTLIRVYRDQVARRYTGAANQWASVTPVILPGHDDRKRAKTRKLIKVALEQSGIQQPCTYEWSAFTRFRNSLSTHKYDSRKQANFYLPSYLQSRSVIHLTLTFNDELKVPGPLVIGAGRHCGFGLMATL